MSGGSNSLGMLVYKLARPLKWSVNGRKFEEGHQLVMCPVGWCSIGVVRKNCPISMFTMR